MKLSRPKGDTAERPSNKGALPILEAWGYFRHHDVAIKTLRVSCLNVLPFSNERQIELAMFADRFHRKEGHRRCLREEPLLFRRQSALQNETKSFR